jgi:glucan phosphoethanolaminetransferase (alkaline phosphatase superfamily)
MLPILITILVTAPILALGTWLYLRRCTLRPSVRIALLSILFLFVLISGPAIIWLWSRGGTARDIASTGSGGAEFFGQLPILWLLGVGGIGVQLFRLCRKKGEL